MNHYDLILWGATGYTGRLVAEYLARHVPSGLRWAIGGRDRGKLDELRARLGSGIDVVTGDGLDAESMGAIARQARVVASTAGPYDRYGTPLVEACVKHGVDYCDITAEVQWIRGNIDRLHGRATETGARIVHCCGFDSVPSDLGVWMLHDHLRRKHGGRLASAKLYVMKIRGRISGGTAASLLDLLELAARGTEVRRMLADPYSLNPEGERSGPDRSDRRGAYRDETLDRWTAPFVMAGINTRVVRRSNALLGYPYGRDFRYAESVACRSWLQARSIALGFTAMILGGLFAPGRWLMRRILPAPGQGPTEQQRESGCFEIQLLGRSDDEPARRVRGKVRGERDPGYAETAKMLAESALCLALDDLAERGGILTPASCMGEQLIGRLRAAGIAFEVNDQ
jgi:short subunit dehydrogenase-like uncharacterized protein